ncbi:hypothetical protein RHMOL_Rhmol05G0176400 [Rhododendron molle]|uniref:Uncharacterized protein n=1 Tax=Rhododendron molle TaxID=49168 RepID=A0ACC0NQC2_RHOML|nr:hypothetical protein RHMOL_Rhmol05G0176400 [Rhododendron molle]
MSIKKGREVPQEKRDVYVSASPSISRSQNQSVNHCTKFVTLGCVFTSAVCRLPQDAILGRRHPGVRQHRPPLQLAGRPLHAVMDYFYEKRWSHTPQYKIGYCQQWPDKVHWPTELGPKPALYFNVGMFVYEPSLSVYDDLLSTLKVTPPTPFAEQRRSLTPADEGKTEKLFGGAATCTRHGRASTEKEALVGEANTTSDGGGGWRR